MNKKVFILSGWILLIGIGVSWFAFGYSNWYLFLLPIAQILLSVGDGKIKKIGNLKMAQVITIVVALIVSVGVVFGFIQLANFIITDKLHLTGSVKFVSQLVAIIVSLYPVKIIFGSLVYKVFGDLNTDQS